MSASSDRRAGLEEEANGEHAHSAVAAVVDLEVVAGLAEAQDDCWTYALRTNSRAGEEDALVGSHEQNLVHHAPNEASHRTLHLV